MQCIQEAFVLQPDFPQCFFSNYEYIQWMEINAKPIGIDKTYKDRFDRIHGYEQLYPAYLILSIKWFIFLLVRSLFIGI